MVKTRKNDWLINFITYVVVTVLMFGILFYFVPYMADGMDMPEPRLLLNARAAIYNAWFAWAPLILIVLAGLAALRSAIKRKRKL
jgi:hypothetical protein